MLVDIMLMMIGNSSAGWVMLVDILMIMGGISTAA